MNWMLLLVFVVVGVGTLMGTTAPPVLNTLGKPVVAMVLTGILPLEAGFLEISPIAF